MATANPRPTRCKICQTRLVGKQAAIDHIEKEHAAMIPEGWSSARFECYLRTGKTEGKCIYCKKPTKWNPATGKYNRMCGEPACKKKAYDNAQKNYIGKHGKVYTINDPEQQKKMVYGKKNSGTYVFEDDETGKKYEAMYDSSYGRDFFEMIDTFLNWDGADIIAPSPHTYYYTYEGKEHFYIPDAYSTSLNLEIELKDGGDNPNKHPKIQAIDKVKEKLKDEVMASLKGQVNYIKICNKDYSEFFAMLSRLRAQDNCPLPKWESKLEPSLESTINEEFVEEAVDLLKNNINLIKRNQLLVDPMLNYNSLLLYYRNKLFHEKLNPDQWTVLEDELQHVKEYLQGVVNGNNEEDKRMNYEAKKALAEVKRFLEYMQSVNPVTESDDILEGTKLAPDYIHKYRTPEMAKTIGEIQKWNDLEKLKIYKKENLDAAISLAAYKVGRLFTKKSDIGLHVKGSQFSKLDDAKAVNPQYKSTKASSSNNCLLCTIAYDMRRRGYDTIAKQDAPIDFLYDIDVTDIEWIYPGSKEVKTGSVSNLIKKLSNEPNGSRGAARCSWSKGSGGHVVAYEIENHKPVLYDAQSGDMYDNVNDLFKDAKDTSYIRLDNITPDFNRILVAIESVTKESIITDFLEGVMESSLDHHKDFLYHLSREKFSDGWEGHTLNPSIPDNYMTKNGYEDAVTPRVCFAPSVDQCLLAMSMKCKRMVFYVYATRDDGSFIPAQCIDPKTKRFVPDCLITGEVWSEKPVKVYYVGKIRVLDSYGDGVPYKYGDNKQAELYYWKYEWIGGKNKAFLNEIITTMESVNDPNRPVIHKPDLTEAGEEFDVKKVPEQMMEFVSIVMDDFKPNGHMNLKDFHMELSNSNKVGQLVKQGNDMLKFVYSANDGRVWFDKNDDVVAMVGIDKSQHPYWIYDLVVSEKYRGYGLGNQVLDYSVKELGGEALTVSKENDVAIRMYEKYGFITKPVKNGKHDKNYMFLTENNHIISDESVYESYYPVSETMFKSKINDDFQPKGKESLSHFTQHKIDSKFINKYKASYKMLAEMDESEFGYYWTNNDNDLVGYVTANDWGWITAIEVTNRYKGYGLGGELLKFSMNRMGGNRLGVHDDNEVAMKLYKKHGFMEVPSKAVNGSKEKHMVFMTTDKSLINKATTEATTSNDISTVYFTDMITPESLVDIYHSLGVELPGKVAVKISTGEPGGHNFLRPKLIKGLVNEVHGTIVECNTAYPGKRNTFKDHWQAIKDHGFMDIADCMIMDESGEFAIPIENGYHLKENFVGEGLKAFDSMIVLSHFKGHAMAGYGGALKNMSIGIASSHGKTHIHTAGTGSTYEELMSHDRSEFQESMADADKSVMEYFGSGNIVYINIANNLSVDCDCDAHPHDPEMTDIGIFASTDPIAVDQACIDAVYNSTDEGKHALIERIESRNGIHTIEAAYELGLGNRKYELITPNGIVQPEFPTIGLTESLVINENDILYNKEAFDNGDINLCFVIGHSGSGKSTLGLNATKGHEDTVDTYSLDDLMCVADHFTMEQLKQYGELIYAFFNGPGKKFYIKYDELIEKKIPGSEYEDKLYPAFVNFAKGYAKSHKDKKFIIEGVWLFCNDEHGKPYFKPEEFKDYAFYIKGTSALVSKFRAAKRDSEYDGGTEKINKGIDRLIAFSKQFFLHNWKWYALDEKRINVFREYFKNKPETYVSEAMQTANSQLYGVLAEIVKFNNTLNKWEYGIVTQSNDIIYRVRSSEDFNNFKMQSPKEFSKSKIGICWDYASYEADYFVSHFRGVDFKTFFVMFDEGKDYPTHTFLLFNLGGKIYWFESSWFPYRGVWEFSDETQALSYIYTELKKPVKGNIKGTFVAKYNALDSKLYGMTVNGYMDYMINLKEYKYHQLTRTNAPIRVNERYSDFQLPPYETASEATCVFESSSFGKISKYSDKNDLVRNFDKWDNKSNNILYVTGLSGSGKSTIAQDIAQKYKAEYVEMDYIMVYFMKNEKCRPRQDKMYNKMKTNSPDAAKFMNAKNDSKYTEFTSWNDVHPMGEITRDFIQFMERYRNNGKKYVICGAFLYDSIPYDWFIDKPIIIKQNDFYKTVVRRTIRESNPKYYDSISAWVQGFVRHASVLFDPRYTVDSRYVNVLRSKLQVVDDFVTEASYIEAMKDDNHYYPVFIFLSYTETNMARLIKAFTHDPYAHSSISFDTNLDNMISFNREGMVVEDIQKSVYKKNVDSIRYSLYMYMASASEYDSMRHFVDELLARKPDLKYNILGLINFIFGRGSSREDKFFCSEFVASVINAGNNKLIKIQPYMTSPYNLAKNKNFVFIKTGILKHYNPKVVDKIIEEKLEEGGFSDVIIK